jgi:hypothetical protein
MTEDRTSLFADILIACHGGEAEKIARRRAERSLTRKAPDWAEMYLKVAAEIARRNSLHAKDN